MEQRTCKICNLPIIEQFGPPYHEECLKCKHCHNGVDSELVTRRIDKLEEGELAIEVVYHQPCEDRFQQEEWKKKPVMVTQARLNYLNVALQLVDSNLDLSTDTNQELAGIETHKWMHEMSLDEKFYFVKRMEAIAGWASIVLSKDPKAREIHLSIAKRDAERQEAVYQYRQDQSDKKVAKRERSDPNSESSLMAAQSKKDKKAIKAMVEFMGLTEEEAVAQIQAQRNKGSEGTVQ